MGTPICLLIARVRSTATPDNSFWSWRTHGVASCPGAFNGYCPHAVGQISAPTTTTNMLSCFIFPPSKAAFWRIIIDLPTRPARWFRLTSRSAHDAQTRAFDAAPPIVAKPAIPATTCVIDLDQQSSLLSRCTKAGSSSLASLFRYENGMSRARSNSTPARPYIARLSVFSRLI